MPVTDMVYKSVIYLFIFILFYLFCFYFIIFIGVIGGDGGWVLSYLTHR